MMAGNPNWGDMDIPAPPPPPSFPTSLPPPLHPPVFQYPHPHHYVFGSFTSHVLSSFEAENRPHELHPQPWSQLLLSGFSDEDAESHKSSASFHQTRNCARSRSDRNNESSPGIDVKQEQNSQHGNPYIRHDELPSGHKLATVLPSAVMVPISSPRSCVTTLCSGDNSVLDFSSNIGKGDHGTRSNNQNPAHDYSERNNTATGKACRKARVQTSSKQSLKVRKEKLGGRIAALHQLVSPFGKTDTASVLFEAFGYIRFLQGQAEALSSPYLGNTSGNSNQHHPDNGGNHLHKDLRSRGLCLVPVSRSMQVVADDNGADCWAPADFHGGF